MLVKLSKITHWYLTLAYKRFHMNPSLIEKRKWNSYPNKTFKTFKVCEIILNKRWGKLWQKTSLKLFAFRTRKILWFNRFRRKKHTCMYCQIRFGILYCSAVFYVIFISLSNISSRRRGCEGRSERRVLSRLALLSSRLNFNSCLSRYSFSWQFRSIVEP